MVSNRINDSIVLFYPYLAPEMVLPTRVRVHQGVMVLKKYPTFLNASGLEFYHQMV